MGFGKPIDPDAASRRMGDESAALLGWRMTISLYRHANIGFKRRLVKGYIDADLEQEANSQVHALQSGHSVATEQRVYGLSQDLIQGASEDMLHVYLGASTCWQIILEVPHGGLGLDYQQGQMANFHQLVATGRIQPKDAKPQQEESGTEQILALLHQMNASNRLMEERLTSEITSLKAQVKTLGDRLHIGPHLDVQDPVSDLIRPDSPIQGICYDANIT